MNGQTVWAGDGCEGAAFDSTAVGDPEFPTAPPDDGNPNTDRIALIERGGPAGNTKIPGGQACGFAEKIDNAAAAGFDGVVIYNQVRPDDGQVNMNTTGVADNVPATIPAVQMRRVDAVGPDGAIAPAPGAFGTAGPNVTVGVVFDGWGYTHLYDAQTSELLDSYAIPESQDPRYASDFGDLTVHEFATDPTEPIAYSSYYGGGVRTFRFSRADGLVPTGKWIDDDGNGSNFWGIEAFTSGGERYFAGSDRDFGLQIFRYTGPAAAKRPVCSDVSRTTKFNKSVDVPLTCTDANSGNTLALRITDQPANGSLGPISGGKVTYTPKSGFFGADSFKYAANDGAADSAAATAKVTVDPPAGYYDQKKKPKITAKARPKRDKKKPFVFKVSGRLKLPSGVSKANGCKGKVSIKAKKGKKTIGSKKTSIKKSCSYKTKVKLRKNAGKRGKAKFQVKFLGNDKLLTAKTKTSAKYGKKKK
jgi:Big-like domain-containing protein/PA domain-containing protein